MSFVARLTALTTSVVACASLVAGCSNTSADTTNTPQPAVAVAIEVDTLARASGVSPVELSADELITAVATFSSPAVQIGSPRPGRLEVRVTSTGSQTVSCIVLSRDAQPSTVVEGTCR